MNTPATFSHYAVETGERTDRTLADILKIDAKDLAIDLHYRMERIRESEREAERATAEVRLY